MGSLSVLRVLALIIFSTVLLNPITGTARQFADGKGNFGEGNQQPPRSPSAKSGDNPKAGEMDQADQECNQAQQEANKQCQPSSSPSGQQAQQASQDQANTEGGSGQQNCDKMSKFLPMLQELLKAFQAACQAAKSGCEAKCGQSASSAQGKCAGITDPKKQAACQGDAGKSQEYGNERKGSCGKLAGNLAAIGQAIANAALQAAAAKQCQKDTEKDCTKPENAQDPKCKKAFDCNEQEFANDPKCICLRNPRANKDCPGFKEAEGLDDAAKKENKKSANSSTTSPSASKTGGTDSTLGGGSASGSPGFPGGSGGGGKGGSVKGSDNKAQDGTPKPGVPEVNAGEYGGGSGAGIKGGSGYPDGDLNSKFGKAKVMSRQEARRIASKDGFTGAHGRTNWQKIHERYRDNRATFIGP